MWPVKTNFCYLGFETTQECIFPFKAMPFKLRCSAGNWKSHAPDFLELLSREQKPNLGTPTVPKNVCHKPGCPAPHRKRGVISNPFKYSGGQPCHHIPTSALLSHWDHGKSIHLWEGWNQSSLLLICMLFDGKLYVRIKVKLQPWSENTILFL